MDLTDTQRQIRDTARAFAEREIAPHAAEWDRAKATPRALFEKMAKVGLMGVCVDPKYGGSGADFVAYILAMEELSAADGGIANVMAANNSPVAAAIQQHGSDWQKENYLAKLCSGTWIGAIHLTEPHTGSDAAAIKTRAVRDGDDWVLNGQKAFITPNDNPGYKVIREEEKLGHRTNDTSQIIFEDMRVPARDVLGEPGRGLGIALANLSAGRIGVAAQAIGGARAALKAARTYAAERITFGKPIIEHQAIAFMLAEMATEIEAARALTLQTARRHAAGEDTAREASMAKLFASEMAERVATKAIQIHGGAGFLNDHPVEKIYRDVRVYQIYEGTSEVQKIVIARLLDGLAL